MVVRSFSHVPYFTVAKGRKVKWASWMKSQSCERPAIKQSARSLKNRSIRKPNTNKTSPSPTPTVIHFFDPAPNFPAPAFSFQLARLQGSSCYHRISGYEHGPASVVMPATSGPGHRRPCGSRPWTTRLKPRPRIHEKLKIT